MALPSQLVRVLATTAAILAILCTGSAAAATEESRDPWQLLETLRRNLSATPQRAGFVQEYLPAGFSSGDRESGDLYLAIPECARWDYLEPYPKSFLLCENEIHAWNPGDRAGRRYTFSGSDEPGIDLLRLRLEELQQRYTAQLEDSQQQPIVVVLSPRSESFAIAEARLTMDSLAEHLLGLSYSDREGNVSRFEISGYQPLSDRAVFEPPAGLEWMEE